MLEIENLTAGYSASSPVLEEINLSLKEGEIIGLLGPNGAGKTTFLRCINGVVAPDEGSIRVEDREVLKMPVEEIARYFGYLPQENESGRMTVFDAVFLGRRPYIGWKPGKEDLEKTNAIINQLGLEDLKLRHTDQLSGGELQKVCIARALVQEPLVLLLDEPTGSLDLKNQREIMQTIKRVVKEHEVGAIISMHDINLALQYTDCVVFLKDGKIFTRRPPDQVEEETVEAVYETEVDIVSDGNKRVVVPG
ncbi:MAG: ABC transporter ATP-binding protein [bacterium]